MWRLCCLCVLAATFSLANGKNATYIELQSFGTFYNHSGLWTNKDVRCDPLECCSNGWWIGGQTKSCACDKDNFLFKVTTGHSKESKCLSPAEKYPKWLHWMRLPFLTDDNLVSNVSRDIEVRCVNRECYLSCRRPMTVDNETFQGYSVNGYSKIRLDDATRVTNSNGKSPGFVINYPELWPEHMRLPATHTASDWYRAGSIGREGAPECIATCQNNQKPDPNNFEKCICTDGFYGKLCHINVCLRGMNKNKSKCELHRNVFGEVDLSNTKAMIVNPTDKVDPRIYICQNCECSSTRQYIGTDLASLTAMSDNAYLYYEEHCEAANCYLLNLREDQPKHIAKSVSKVDPDGKTHHMTMKTCNCLPEAKGESCLEMRGCTANGTKIASKCPLPAITDQIHNLLFVSQKWPHRNDTKLFDRNESTYFASDAYGWDLYSTDPKFGYDRFKIVDCEICQCQPGYSGQACQHIFGCENFGVISENHDCSISDNATALKDCTDCICPLAFAGHHCQETLCQRDSVADSKGENCNCTSKGHTGPHCQNSVCKSSTTSGCTGQNATYVERNKDGYAFKECSSNSHCNCTNGWTGEFCTLVDTTNHTCHDHGTVHPIDCPQHHHGEEGDDIDCEECRCELGYVGVLCEIEEICTAEDYEIISKGVVSPDKFQCTPKILDGTAYDTAEPPAWEILLNRSHPCQCQRPMWKLQNSAGGYYDGEQPEVDLHCALQQDEPKYRWELADSARNEDNDEYPAPVCIRECRTDDKNLTCHGKVSANGQHCDCDVLYMDPYCCTPKCITENVEMDDTCEPEGEYTKCYPKCPCIHAYTGPHCQTLCTKGTHFDPQCLECEKDPANGKCKECGSKCVGIDCPQCPDTRTNCTTQGNCVIVTNPDCKKCTRENGECLCKARSSADVIACSDSDAQPCRGSDCPGGSTCPIPPPPVCTDGSKCINLKCSNGDDCKPPPGPCTDGSKCINLKCSNGDDCKPPPGPCTDGSTCINSKCSNGDDCQPPPGPVICTDGGECVDSKCSDGSDCVCIDESVCKPVCPGGFTCNDALCPSGKPCVVPGPICPDGSSCEDEKCPNGLTCGPGPFCNDGTKCLSDGNCPDQSNCTTIGPICADSSRCNDTTCPDGSICTGVTEVIGEKVILPLETCFHDGTIVPVPCPSGDCTKCNCTVGYTGKRCADALECPIRIDSFEEKSCGVDEINVRYVDLGTATCQCSPKWKLIGEPKMYCYNQTSWTTGTLTGSHLWHNITYHDKEPAKCERVCMNGGTVSGYGKASKCNCTLGWTGPFCEEMKLICIYGKIETTAEGSKCVCDVGWSGHICTEQVCVYGCANRTQPCEKEQNAVCTMCKCDPGYTGPNCEYIDCNGHGRAVSCGEPVFSFIRQHSEHNLVVNKRGVPPAPRPQPCPQTCKCDLGWTGPDCKNSTAPTTERVIAVTVN